MFDAYSARAALAEAGVDPSIHDEVIARLYRRMDRQRALQRRNYWLRRAAEMIGGTPGAAGVLHGALRAFQFGAWPRMRYMPTPPANEPALRRVLFEILRATEDAACDINATPPCTRHIRRLLSGHNGIGMSGDPREDVDMGTRPAMPTFHERI